MDAEAREEIPCLDEEAIVAFCAGALAPSAQRRAEEHLPACDECRALVSAFARSSHPASVRPDVSALGVRLVERGPFEIVEAIECVLQLSEAVALARDSGAPCAGLLPSRIAFARGADGAPIVKVSAEDLPSTRATPDDPSSARRARAAEAARYGAPEQFASPARVDGRADVWALGAVLHELVSGEPLWRATTIEELRSLVLSAPPARLREVTPGAPLALEAIVSRCLVADPDARIASVADLALALEPLASPAAFASIERVLALAGRARGVRSSILPPPPGPDETAPSTRFAASRRWVVAASAGVALALALALALASRVPPRSPAVPVTSVVGVAN